MAQNQSKIRINLPPENWLDIFACLPRRPTLTEIMSFVCCQFWQISHILLHEKGKICLEKMHFDSEIVPASANDTEKKDGNDLSPKRRAILWSTNRKVPFPELKMPENIVDFKELVISHLDEQCFQMLDKMSSILNGIHIWMDFDDDEEQQQSQAMTMFGQILHRFAAIISIKSIQLPCADSVLFMAINFPQIWQKLEFVYFEEFIKIDDKLFGILCAWLNQNGAENESKTRFLTATVPERYAQMLLRQNIEEFHKSSHSANYFVRLTIMGNPMENFVKRQELNQKVGDILTAEANFAAKIYSSHLYIFRHQIDAEPEWIEAMKVELDGWRVEKCCRRKMVLRVE